MASRLMIPERPAYEPVRLAGAELRASASVRQVLDRESRRKTAGEVQADVKVTQMIDLPEPDGELVEVPVGSWFG
jgi:hypothetical protein